MLEYLSYMIIGEIAIMLSDQAIINGPIIDTTINVLPDKNLTIDSINKISPIDDHLTYGIEI